ncbi:ATP-binding cassette domain-containing protein [Brachybacterium saurashtrense]|uniref:UvrABC system protein A n=1 Tax=Brachybacterium saurashtrense TaxID=556288 RepID=A0A345YKN6_9MICO|nr:excinuclease ABC subunit UvrA [Brachybacterium saurashtrense]AXK44488.1 excinuclease ABC subunit UvrA [Brachybacterium saurashtrense]RRR23100.1 excinuclease ABC subunit UvrA [Brachybacterium saurashtrense]
MTAVHPADAHDVIRVRGARENNLRDISLDLPKRRLTVFTGVSGSGKSSLVFSTIAAESQRMINETYSAFLQGFMPSLARPDVDELQGLTTAIIVDQERMGANVRSTVGTVTDADAHLRTLFATLAQPHVGGPGAYSFNVPSVTASGAMTVQKGASTIAEKTTFSRVGGMCPRCEGMGEISDVDLAELFDEDKSLDEGPFTIPNYAPGGWYVKVFARSGFFPSDRPIRTFTTRQRHDFLYKEPTKVDIDGTKMTYEGLIPKIRKSMLSKDRDAMQPHIRAFVDRAVKFVVCPDCEGSRLAEHARTSRIDGLSIADATALQITELAAWVESLRTAHHGPTVAPLLTNLSAPLDAFVRIGLGYLSLNRPSGTLSGGESQRTRMIRHLGSALTDVTYVFDEPTIGLHPHDIATMNSLLEDLRDKGNTVLVVEHKPETIAIADHIVDLGPRAGADGGTVQYEGDLPGLRASGTLTGEHLDRRVRLKPTVREATGVLPIRGAATHNLQSVDVDVPLGVLTVVTGVAGSGKSTLVHSSMPKDAGAIVVDQTAIRGSRRSNPATYTGLLDPLRKAFAAANGVKPALFSNNSEGACPVCKGAGVIVTELGFMETVETLCEECEGRRFRADVLEHTFGGRNIAEVLGMSVTAARELLTAERSSVPAAARVLGHLEEVGLGYLTIGQPLTTLSGGERQRLKLATHLGDTGGLYVLDEPTAGLHLADVDQLLALLDRLVDSGKSVIVIEHHQAVMAHADHLIDLGPGAGAVGGRIVFQGTPAQLVADGSTLTGEHLRQYVRA